MIRNKARGGRALRSAVGMAALVLLMAGGAWAANTIWDEESGSPMPFTWNYTNFDGFNNSGIGAENLTVNQTNLGASPGKTRTIRNWEDPLGAGLIYNTKRYLIEYEVSKNKGLSVKSALDSYGSKVYEGNYYSKLNLFGETYVALNGQANKLTKQVMELKKDEQKILNVGEIWDLGEGYTLSAQSIDAKASPRQAWVVLSKNGSKLDDKVVGQGQVYTYTEKSLGGETDVPMFVTYVDSVFAGATTDFVILKYTWLLSRNVFEIKAGNNYGVFRVLSSSSNEMKFENDYTISLVPNTTINLSGNIKFKTIDDINYLKFYPTSKPKSNITDSIPPYPPIASMASWDIQENYVLNLTGIDAKTAPRQARLQLSKNGMVIKDSVVMQGSVFEYCPSNNCTFNASIDAIFTGGTSSIVRLKEINQYSETSGTVLLNNSTHSFISGVINRTNESLNEGYIISVLGIDVKAYPRLTWLRLYKNEIMMDEKVAMVGDIYTYYNQTNKVLYGEVSAIFAGDINDVVQLKNVTQYSELNGNILINGTTYTIATGSIIPIPTPKTTPTPTYGSYEIYGTIASETGVVGEINLSTLPVTWTPQSFAGFYYDLNSNMGNEELTLKNIDISGRNIPVDGLYYNTSAQPRMLNVVKEVFGGNVTAAQAKGLKKTGIGQAFEGGNYQVVGWQGEKYVAFNGKVNKLSKLVLEHGPSSTEKKTLWVGETWDIGNGWTLTARSIDAKAYPRQAWLILGKDGVKKDDIFLTEGNIYTYVDKRIFNESDVPMFVTYIDYMFVGATSAGVQLKYTWAISPDVQTIQSGEKFGTLKVDSLTPNLVLKNTDSIINLPKGSIVDITDKLKFKVADSDTLGFIPVSILTTQGTYEVHGTVWNETSINGFGGTGKVAEWNASNFKGFLYDIDNNIGNESLRILQTDLNKNQRIITLNNLAYGTKAQPKMLNVVKKIFNGNVTAAAASGLERTGTGQAFENGHYYIMGWQGNISVALNGRVDKISKLILEQSTEAEIKTLSAGENWNIGEGWILKAQTIEATVVPKQVRLVLSKDDVEKDNKIIAMGKIYTYIENSSTGEDNVPFFVTYIDNIFTDVTTDKVKLKYTWAISSNITTIQSGNMFGIFTVVDLDIANKHIGLKNRDASISLSRDSTSVLGGNLKFKVADNANVLRFMPVIVLAYIPTPPGGGGGGGGGGRGFDTGTGSYPSIMGTHNGTLKLNQSINMSKMYTYPSPGTGGHSEYVRIWNLSGWSIEAAWSGYSGDWHNITLSMQPFTLEAGEYNYTIRTGSYPQIIHKQNHTTPDGSIITSTEFIDANGRRYNDWIPAIRLE